MARSKCEYSLTFKTVAEPFGFAQDRLRRMDQDDNLEFFCNDGKGSSEYRGYPEISKRHLLRLPNGLLYGSWIHLSNVQARCVDTYFALP